jgi:hypothetical protein
VVLTGNFSDYSVDTNSDGIYEQLVVNVEVIVSTSTNHALNARLMDKFEDEIVWAATTVWLSAGDVHTVVLRFDGPTIYTHGVNGPYDVRDVYVYNTSNTGESDYIYDAYTTTSAWRVSNEPPVADAGPDQTVERSSVDGAEVQLDGSGSYDPDDDTLSYEWTWAVGSASGVSPVVVLPPGLNVVVLAVSDGEYTDSDTVEVSIVDTTPPQVELTSPAEGVAVQDGIVFRAIASDLSGVDSVYFYLREADGGSGTPIGFEELVGTYNSVSGKWEYSFDTTIVEDGYYVVLAKALDNCGNAGWSSVVGFSVRNWAIIELLPSSQEYRAGRTMPVKFSVRIHEDVDPATPFVYNEGLEIRIYEDRHPSDVLQVSTFGGGAEDYRIDVTAELYITNFKTAKRPTTYVVEVWRASRDFMVGDFSFTTSR